MASRASVGVYVPPFATTAASPTAATTAARATGTSISFAQIGGTYGASGAASGTATAAIVDSTGGVDSSSLLEYFTKPYIDAHTLSIPTWRYAYILWFVVVGTLIVWSVAYHLSGASHGGSALGAWFRKFSIRRIAIRGKTKRKDAEGGKTVVVGRKSVRWASPTYAQMAVVVALIGVALCLSLIGPDYIAPTTCVFGGECGYSSFYGSGGPPKTTFGSKVKRQAVQHLASDPLDPPPPMPASLGYSIHKRGVNNPNGWAPFNDPLLAGSNTDIQANWWTAAARLGLISYAMLPLAVTFALKQWPFNIWATPFLTAYHFDKTAILHRWSGRVIWLFATGHSAAWLYQLLVDKDPFGRPVLVPALQYFRFVAGIAAWGLLTAITAFSFKPIRNRYYELFYWSHVALILLFLAACIVHHRPLMWWPIIAAIWWGAERFVRGIVFLYINGFHKGILFSEPKRLRSNDTSFALHRTEKVDGFIEAKGDVYPPMSYDTVPPFGDSPRASYPPSSPARAPYASAPSYRDSPAPTYQGPQPRSLPPPGFASAQLLPGRTVRLVLHTPIPIRWRPGQHVFLTMPSVKLVQSHPYTIVSIDERAKGIAPVGGGGRTLQGSEVVMLVRAQKGFSKALWDFVAAKRKAKEDHGATHAELVKGVNIRALVSWPIGSSARTPWEAYDSLLIICGGTGITFGMSVLEYTVRRMARRDVDSKYRTTRVRLVWILREYSHLSWVAPALHKCLDMLDTSQLQIELFVSRDAPRPSRRSRRTQASTAASMDEFAPPRAPFARQARGESPSRDDYDSDLSDAEDDRASSRMMTEEPTYGGQIDSVTDLVLFDGEDDDRTEGEMAMSTQVRTAGKLRRALSRRGHQQPHSAGRAPARPFRQSRTDSDFSKIDLGRDAGLASMEERDAIYHDPYDRSEYADTGSYADLPFATPDHSSEIYDAAGRDTSVRNLVGYAQPTGKRNSFAQQGTEEAALLDVTEEDEDDIEVVAEHAKTGYPKLKEIMDEEVGRSAGKTMVACCGPNGLNTLVRHMVSDRIVLGKVFKGDPHGQVSLVCEDFSY